MQRLAANTGNVDDRLTNEWPKQGAMIWNIFCSLGRPASMNGIARISQQEIRAWQENHGIKLNNFELSLIEMFDLIAIEILSKDIK